MLESTPLTSVPSYKHVSGIESCVAQVKDALNRHPKASLIAGTAFTALGALASNQSTTTLGTALTAVGVSTLLATCIQWKHLAAYMIGVPLLSAFGIQWNSSVDLNRYEDRSCSLNGRVLGNVHHENKQPVLELTTEDPYEMGLAQGYLFGEQIQEAFEHVLQPMMSLCGTLTGDFSGEFYKRQAKLITIPEPYRREIQGLAAGVQHWAKQRGVSASLTEELAINAHKLTDIYKAIGCQRLFGIAGFNSFGCSTAVVKKGDELAVGRTLDWPSMGKMGELAYIRRHKAGGKQIEMQAFAGIVGAHTAFNKDGLVAIINENGTISRAGVPYAMLCRQIIEQCATVKEADAVLKSENYHPASSHHITLADRNSAAIYQMVLDDDRKFIKRELDFSKENDFIVVTNHTFTDENEMLENTLCDPSSMMRCKAMSETLTTELKTDHAIADVVQKALKAVNVMDTVATAHYDLTGRDGKKVRVVKYANNNYWAANV